MEALRDFLRILSQLDLRKKQSQLPTIFEIAALERPQFIRSSVVRAGG